MDILKLYALNKVDFESNRSIIHKALGNIIEMPFCVGEWIKFIK